MRIVSPETQAAWEAVYKGGQNRAVTRATISRLYASTTPYERSKSGAIKVDSGVWRSALFDQTDQPVELPNLASCTISRSVDQDAATCTLELWNTRILGIGEVPTDSDLGTELDAPGWFSPFRGASSESLARWDHVPNGWRDMILPDRVIRTYQGYGINTSAIPELDANLYLTGVWIIDDVELTSDRTIKVTCRDMVRLLMDLLTLPPTIPWSAYPLQWESYHEVDNPDVVSKSQEAQWFRPNYQTDSNIPYVGLGYTDGGRAYVSNDGSVLGHKGAHAFDKDKTTYWLSVGNYPSWSSAYEYVQGSFSSRTISAVRVHLWGGPYKIYISVKANGVWQGATKIPYRARSVDTNADIPFVRRIPRDQVTKNGIVEVKLPKAYANATAVRITFSDLMDTGIGTYRYRAGCRTVQVLASTTVTTTTDGGTHTEGNYGDYTDIVKMLCAWGGLHWPANATLRRSDNVAPTLAPSNDDPVLKSGRVWGDFMSTGTAGVADLDATGWDKISLMDGVSQIRDIVGFNFFVDEYGGAVWRLPNVYEIGNYVCGAEGGPYSATRSTDLLEIEDDRHLLKANVKLSSRNVRDMVIVTNVAGNYGGASAGWNPAPTGFTRVGGWTDQRFTSERECQIMADLITLRQLFEYHKSPITIPAHPGIQVDDQIRLFERTTSNTYVHYVRGYTTTWEALSGRWTQDLDVHWLGEDPFTRWAFDREKLSTYTKAYLSNLGIETTGVVGTPAPPTGGSSYSGLAMPTTDPSGWTRVYQADDWTGANLTTVFNPYPDPWTDTSGNGRYSGATYVTTSDSQLHIQLKTVSGVPRVTALQPRGGVGRTYGRFSVCARMQANGPGYKVAWLLWPNSEVWPGDGEIDFPETNIPGTPHLFMHYANPAGGQDAFTATGISSNDWHVYTLEWTAGNVKAYVDGALIGHSTNQVPTGPMRWVLQCETNLDGYVPASSVVANIDIDWIVEWTQ